MDTPITPRHQPTLLWWSRLVVGSSRARMPQLTQNVSARASRITTLACQHTQNKKSGLTRTVAEQGVVSDNHNTEKANLFARVMKIQVHTSSRLTLRALAGGM